MARAQLDPDDTYLPRACAGPDSESGGGAVMLVVADVNISQDEVEFLRGIDTVERVVYVAQDLRRSMPDEEIVEYALENDALIVTRDKGFNYNPKKQWKQDHPSVFIIRHKNRLVKEVGRQVKHAMDVFGHHAARGETVAGVLRRGKFRFMVIPMRNRTDSTT